VRRNLVRRINRLLKQNNRRLCSAKNGDGDRSYYLVDTFHPIHDIEGFGQLHGVVSCYLCNRPAMKWQVDGCNLCANCALEIDSERLRAAGGAR
jgi:hypothetical protein